MYVLLARLRDFSGSLVYMMRPSYFYDMGLDVLWASVEFQVACISMWVGKHTIVCRYGMLCFSMRSHPSCLLASPACRARYLSGDGTIWPTSNDGVGVHGILRLILSSY